ncbi:MAG TPA: amino acid permease [Candidatus Acidoferrales bacterium]|nr:amino acid permease [Candidatus Acidoferrales bacterium]
MSHPIRGHGFGTAPVFLAAISTILGAIMFLRFGYAVGHLGLLGALWVILLGHMVTIPTAMALAEIATNRRVGVGGEYYIISRSFGITIGGAIGVALYLSQAISVAFYMVAFAEAFQPVYGWLEAHYGFVADPRMVSLPATFALLFLLLRRGAALGVRALWVVVGLLAISLAAFFLGKGPAAGPELPVSLIAHISNPDLFARVFAIVFPAFTGFAAGVGLSGDLKNPARSIPLGTLAATLVGMLIYVALVIKLAWNATPQELATDQLIMSKIALWGPIILIGLAAATFSSALGSILIAPRTLQAMARDRVLPIRRVNAFLAYGRGGEQEPVNATLVSGIIALGFVAIGTVDFVAQIISMFFMVTYGAIATISFLEHFAANPSYRPTFRSRWYLSLLGAVMCFMMMFQMQPFYALLALAIMWGIYWSLHRRRKGERDLSAIFQGVMFQLTRRLRIAIQQSGAGSGRIRDWRPSFLSITRHSLDRVAHFELLRWICHRHGFGQFIHYEQGKYSAESEKSVDEIESKLIRRTEMTHAGIFVATVIAPSFKTALAQVVQLPGISGLPNNSVLLEFSRTYPEEIEEVVEGARLVAPLGFNVCILRSSEARFGYRKSMHLWLTKDDLENAPLMILLAYIILGHPDWESAEISIFACYPASRLEEELEKLNDLIAQGRLPISRNRITPVPYDSESSFERAAAAQSADADLVILGLTREEIHQDAKSVLLSHQSLKDVLFVNANQRISIS